MCEDCLLVDIYGIITSSMKITERYCCEELFMCSLDCYIAVHLPQFILNAGYGHQNNIFMSVHCHSDGVICVCFMVAIPIEWRNEKKYI